MFLLYLFYKGDFKVKIKQKETEKIDFYELKKGDVFQYNNIFYMVIETVEDSSYDCYNAVTLNEGELAYFEDTDEIIKIEGYFKQE